MKTTIENLRQQHDAAEQIAASIMSLVLAYRDEYDAAAIARLIGKLNALLRVHFAYEDTILYPSLVRSGDGEAAALALKFSQETGSLAPQFEDFVRRWSGPSIIAAMFDVFGRKRPGCSPRSVRGSSARTTCSTRWPSA